MILVRRSSNRITIRLEITNRITSQQRVTRGKGVRILRIRPQVFIGMSSHSNVSPLYAAIYDPANNIEHMRTRYVSETEDRSAFHAHYEPYGQKSQEKMEFIDSINQDHELWSKPVQERVLEDKGVSIKVKGEFIERESYELSGSLWPGQFMCDTFKRVEPKLDMTPVYPEMWEDLIDTSDRENKGTYVFSKMLCDYVEKCGPEERKRFFEDGGWGCKWSKDKYLMKKIGTFFQRENTNFVTDPDYNLSLSDATVRRYPKHFFLQICDLYLTFMEKKGGEKKSKLNPNAVPFVPKGICDSLCASKGQSKSTTPRLQRSSPKKILGVYAIDRPIKPEGNPLSQRPRSTENSFSKLCWSMKGETDSKIEDLNRKIDLLIGLNSGPIVQAENV